MRCDCCGSADWTPLFSENGIRLGQCPRCDLLYIDDIPEPQRRMTEMEAGHYAGTQEIVAADKQSQSELILRSRFQGFVDLAREHTPSGRWLDIGCGAGLLLGLARDASYEIEGIELSADRMRIAAQQTGATVHGLPVEDVGYPDDSFDVISMINVFSHLISPTETFRELARILRPGGIVVMATGEMTAGAQKGDMLHWNLGDHLHFLGDRTMAEYAERLDLAVLHHERTWLPDEMFSREWLRVRGRSKAKNALKSTVNRTPGGLALMRAVMLRRQADSSAHSGVFVLAPR
ncbi:class I SAM-dependent methyltransferase [Aeromicrobium stalagmiti]|uniref:class I SAM-dependent methyltransferase n=1 Tax=Aeromicrobium stalagmiti TaxID=2738988 RepID=UPI001567CD26|nr:class I SAM-dependent methyltransferase [Aeromicrobium stalagmiti]NRQ49336.1 class I SAM-dependent methyltransferase [Aeromicrobium stalagmiti]